jgi:pimeloyl-ACP methyl ester carboxylesterase
MRGRRLLVEYVGDVAIYVSAHTLSTFDQVRDDIKALVRRIVCAIYQQGRYERVVIVGHSLGSLIAYDALNAAMLADALSGAYGVQRTRRFVTFGSPLDKTAFFFRAVDAVTAPIREGLAASVQPLLIYRPSPPPTFDWINLRSPHDIISGALDLYPAVDNRTDAQADTPLWAHVQFWSNELLAATIAEACVDHPIGWPPARTEPRYEVASDTGIGTAVRGV